MKILVTSSGSIITTAFNFEFGPWEENDTINDKVVHKWKSEDENGNLLGYVIDEKLDSIYGAEDPVCQIFEIESFPEDYVSGKYLYIDGAFTVNPDYKTPPMSREEMSNEIIKLNATIEAQAEEITLLNETLLEVLMG